MLAAQMLWTRGYRLALVCAVDGDVEVRVVYLFVAGPPDRRIELVVTTRRDQPRVPSLAAISFPAGRFEREIHDLFGVEPVGHPAPRRLVLHQHWPEGWYPMRRDAPASMPWLGTPGRTRSSRCRVPASTRSPSDRSTPA